MGWSWGYGWDGAGTRGWDGAGAGTRGWDGAGAMVGMELGLGVAGNP